MRIALASDHAGIVPKRELAAWLGGLGCDLTGLGANGTESVNDPQFGARLAA